MDSDRSSATEGSPEGQAGTLTGRWLASAVLIPAIPLLLASVLALAAFYAAPERFGAWLSKLPGDAFLRTAMIFAPATLLAVVVLATLYLRDSADSEEGAERIAGGLGRVARGSLLISGPLLAIVGALEAARYLDAERVEAWLDALPGTRYLVQALELAPLALVLAVGVGIMLGYAPGGAPPIPAMRPKPIRPWTRARFGRVAAGVVLTLATPALLLSVFGLAYQVIWPERLAELLEPLPGDTYLRLLLMLAPTGLLAVLLLALLYLLGPLDPERTQPMRPQPVGLARRMGNRRLAGRQRAGSTPVPARVPMAILAWRSDLAMIVLVVGMVVAVAAGALLVGGMLVLLVVR